MSASLKTLKRIALKAQYRAQRPRVRAGDLIAQSIKDIKTLAIRVGTASTYSHVGVIDVDEEDGRVYVIEAVKPYAHRVPLSTIGSFYHLPLRARWTHATDVFVARHVLGTKYSEWDAIKAYFAPLPAGTVSQCAALAREVLIRAGVDLGTLSRPDSIVQVALDLGSTITYIYQSKTQ